MHRTCALIVPLLFACSHQGAKDHGTFATYNAGLAYAYVDYAEERQPLVGPAVATLGADVVCLQEVWMPEDVEDVLSATAAEFPHSFWMDTYDPVANTGPPACTEEESAPLMDCVDLHCAGASPADLDDCVLASCAAEFGALSSVCMNCLAANLGHTADEIFEACATGSKTFLYEAANGLAILSRWPLEDTDHIVLDSTFNKRLVISAKTRNGEGERIALFCTHTTPEFGDIPYPGTWGSWAEEQTHQIGQILAYVDERTEDGDMAVLMGDMNSGPAVPPSIDPELSENYSLFTAAGFVDPYADDVPLCTFCAENPLNAGDTTSVLIDHVFFLGFPLDVTYDAVRVLDAPVTVETTGGSVETRISDHYGVSVGARS